MLLGAKARVWRQELNTSLTSQNNTIFHKTSLGSSASMAVALTLFYWLLGTLISFDYFRLREVTNGEWGLRIRMAPSSIWCRHFGQTGLWRHSISQPIQKNRGEFCHFLTAQQVSKVEHSHEVLWKIICITHMLRQQISHSLQPLCFISGNAIYYSMLHTIFF